MERRGRIPVAKFRTQEGKTRSRSRVREPDYNEQDPETDLFTLIEDNIALKEDNKTLKAGIEDYKKLQNELLEENSKLKEELENMRSSQSDFESRIKDMASKLTKTTTEKSALDKLHRMKIEKINSLTTQLQSLQENQDNLSTTLEDSMGLKNKILKLIPSLTNNEMESLIDIDDNSRTSILTGACIERLLDEFVQLKTNLGAVELQLYEANEKISDLMENQQHIEEENESLRSENTNLTRVAQLLTQNMKESVETSKKMEEALIKLKQRNDDLSKKSKDLLDGQVSPPTTPTTTPITPSTIEPIQSTEQPFEEPKDGLPSPNREHGERIVEMKSLMEAAIEKTTNDEIKTLHIKLEILEEELKKALARAEKAESTLETYKRQQSNENNMQVQAAKVATPLMPPPPPPPIPASLLYSPNISTLYRKPSSSTSASSSSFGSTCQLHSSQNNDEQTGNGNGNGGGSGGGYGGASAAGGRGCDATTNRINESFCSSCNHQMKQQVGAATGLDALVRELKSGKVTLRRNRRKTKTNEALQEMFQVLEISQKQNRNSQIVIDIHI
ncbi:shootin-1 isoform X3 [Eupeodes corollae]|uniref:shootin-1 isoform X3 n=1 Tax=Eupeodes corollae TaxID=290404 RepID=UPI0024933BEA|nr:shootin-1 isoform X3 [Eupeodes corollae]